MNYNDMREDACDTKVVLNETIKYFIVSICNFNKFGEEYFIIMKFENDIVSYCRISLKNAEYLFESNYQVIDSSDEEFGNKLFRLSKEDLDFIIPILRSHWDTMINCMIEEYKMNGKTFSWEFPMPDYTKLPESL